ncbi:MAG TPA: hypothetical protein VMN36_08405 [Verrucomicrobiales bacterium]|nr:hypothetical protein [Verrucomicrobiales bacterium]
MQICVVGLLGLLLSASATFAAKVQHTYDASGRLVATDYGNGKVTLFTYDNNGNLLNRSTTIATNADVRLTKTSSTATPNVGAVFTYTLTVTNAGPDPATGVMLNDTVPFGAILHSASPSQGVAESSGRTVTAQFGVLPVNASAILTLSVRHGFEGSFTNIATVAANEADANLANNTATLITTSALPSFGFDSDDDGMPSWWEALNISSGAPFTDLGDNGPDGDLDRDGIRNFDEWIAGTRANDPNSRFEIVNQIFAAGDAGEFSLTISSSPIRQYDLEFTEDVSQPFVTVETVNGTGAPITFSHTSGTPHGYYRVRVRIPEL